MSINRTLRAVPTPASDPAKPRTETEEKLWQALRDNPGSTATGTDLNRNWPYQWGCCGGSSSSPSSSTYRGSGPGSGTETSVVTDFVESRVINGEQRLTAPHPRPSPQQRADRVAHRAMVATGGGDHTGCARRSAGSAGRPR